MFNAWIDRAEELAERFRTASPFPLLVIDDFLDTATARALLAEFPAPDAMPRSRDYVFGNKHELSSVAEQGPTSRAFYDALMGPEFQRFISTLTGTELFVDPAFHGGGFHQSGDGGFLDTHVDFNMHPLHPDWKRTLNVLLYLNEDWRPEYDGRLLVKNGADGETRAIEPLFNRGLIMVTDDRTYHGFARMSLPPGVTRKSIATYAYELVPEGSVVARTTGWAPEAAGVFKRTFARHYDRAVRIKTRVLGSATAKNR
ncbi:2OG-Fe(II) oxygenase [Blastococcus sp. TF02A-26]|uniref:2OG-Fe(II) oxygenase n=1 Tax=Blastococcus sp. TF02A-26 TaxID=2250577 RepID=UPI000DE83B2C|nr:2OG-Fe(II) oxygenase [Blastococcus sp. TF02A-26]RBY86136.1 2OG-Fe(II) oxygenase [Blastococcus sp. TF02A-26]